MAKTEQHVVERAAWRMVRAWGGEWDDYAQEARLAIEQARDWYKPEFGVPWIAYAQRAVYRALHGYASKARSPVSGSLHKLAELNAARAVGLPGDHEDDQAVRSPHALPGDLAAKLPTPEAQAAADEWQRCIAARINAVLEADPDGEGHLARLVLLGNHTAQQVADCFACSRWRVFRAARRARQAIATDPALRALAREADR
jgi:hypothetical protein